MAFNLPLPRVVADVGPGGGIPSSINALNELDRQNLANKFQTLQNQFYGPNIQSEIENRNALTKGQNITNEYLPDKLRLANAFAQLQNQYYGPNMQANINSTNANTERTRGLTPLDIENKKLENEWYVRNQQAKINAENALANYRGQGGAGASVAQKDLNALTRQIQIENPQLPNEDTNAYNMRINDMQGAYLNGDQQTSAGQPLKPLSGTGQSLLNNIHNRNVPAAVRNQVVQLDQLVTDLKDYDIDAVKKFAGPIGRLKLKYAQANMVTNPDDPNIDPDARRFLSAMNSSIINMDQMRKAFGTSVVPDYVYKTIGKLTNPADSMWNDATQVGMNYQKVLDTMEKNRNNLIQKYRKGIDTGYNPTKQPTINVDNRNTNRGENKATGKEVKMVQVKTPGGEIISLPEDGAKRLIKDHPDHKIVKNANG